MTIITTTTTNKSSDEQQYELLPHYYTKEWQLVSQGAEARIWLLPSFLSIEVGGGSRQTTTMAAICKERFPKLYRHPTLNRVLTKARTKSEVKCLTKCRRAGVSVPAVLAVDLLQHQSSCLFLEYISGCTVRSFFNNPPPSAATIQSTTTTVSPLSQRVTKKLRTTTTTTTTDTESQRSCTRLDEMAMKVAYAIGVTIAKLHNANIVHGDLTTSNMMIRNGDDTTNLEIVLIDFGLASSGGGGGGSKHKANTHLQEELAVDLHLLERAFATTHVGSQPLLDELLRAYKALCKCSDAVFQRLSQVKLRGRKRDCFG